MNNLAPDWDRYRVTCHRCGGSFHLGDGAGTCRCRECNVCVVIVAPDELVNGICFACEAARIEVENG